MAPKCASRAQSHGSVAPNNLDVNPKKDEVDSNKKDANGIIKMKDALDIESHV